MRCDVCNLPDPYRGQGDGVGSCDCPRCDCGTARGSEFCTCPPDDCPCEDCQDDDYDDVEWPDDVWARSIVTISPAGGVL